jgi:hypothetical protein
MQSPYTIDSGCEGPSVLITAGVHGDEHEPIIAANNLIRILSSLLKNGKVTIVPIVNTTAVAKGSRYGEDGLDLARVCPGNNQGSVTEIDAAKISVLISQSDYLIDMHTGGKLFDIYPLAGICFTQTMMCWSSKELWQGLLGCLSSGEQTMNPMAGHCLLQGITRYPPSMLNMEVEFLQGMK